MPDTQYLFDETSLRPEPIEASLAYLRAERADQNIVFLAHLGDLTQNGQAQEMRAIAKAWTRLRGSKIPFSTLTGNHDVDSKTDDQRGATPYLANFRPSTGDDGVVAVSPDGYNSLHRFSGGGRDWLLLALDWRLSPQGFAWAQAQLDAHKNLPTILTTHELVQADTGDGVGVLSEYGQLVWDRLVARNDQVFLTLNGHFWPSGRLRRTNAAGHSVDMHLTNYQQRYYGGAAVMRLYHFDLERNVIDVETICPWVENVPPAKRCELMQEELVVSTDLDRFTVEIDFDARFKSFAPAPVRRARTAASQLVRGTVAYWRWDSAQVGHGATVKDLSGHGNDLEVVGDAAPALRVVDDFHPDQPGHRSLAIGGAGTTNGDYLRTVASAPLNRETFQAGYTVEMFFHLPADWGSRNAWSSLLSRQGMSAEAGKKPGDPEEPVATLSLSGSRELQWAVYPVSLPTSLTNWGHELRTARWWHVAVVNNGTHTTMYVDGCPVVRNPATPNRGLSTLNRRWLLGGYEYANKLDKVFQGTIGDVRIANRALRTEEFMIG
ncbi:LamG-like jellyroll fold domain-containing protein [Nigerium massiliense]|uniref:LamG-like jellyroll fold domain-containing protein n=1 Tax=Nigerium massiliense TaxID=1522317 RepID=UPI0006948A85|nr:LamG-like jellyroll fold domain-containing protein [Nigerium massiliense]